MWEDRYTAATRLFSDQPSPLLVQHQALLQPGMRALAVGDGEGRNGVWLAAQGLDVLSVDISPTALERAGERARSQGVALKLECLDILTWDWPRATCDLIAYVFVHLPPPDRQSIHRAMIRALRPGGLLLLEAFHRDQIRRATGGPSDPALLYSEAILRRDFAELEVLQLAAVETEVRVAGEYRGQGAAVHFVGRKPVAAL